MFKFKINLSVQYNFKMLPFCCYPIRKPELIRRYLFVFFIPLRNKLKKGAFFCYPIRKPELIRRYLFVCFIPLRNKLRKGAFLLLFGQKRKARKRYVFVAFRFDVFKGVKRSIIGGGGGWLDHIDIFMFTDCKNNRFQKKLIVQNTNI